MGIWPVAALACWVMGSSCQQRRPAVSPLWPDGCVSRPRLASMTFADFVRLSRAYVWVLIGCTILGALLMIAKTTRDPVLYSATSSGLVRVGRRDDGG